MRHIEQKRVLVTGGAGFIGSHLCEDLLRYNNHVVCLDNFANGKRSNIEPFLNRKTFTLIEGDIRDLSTCLRAAKGCDIILHEAALGSVPRSINDPITSTQVNIDGFLNVLIAARDHGVQRLVYAASSSTYGDSEKLPKTEDHIGKPLSTYAVTKLANELYAHVFHLNYGLSVTGLRYFNVFGERQDPLGAYAAAIPKFIQHFIKHEAPLIFGDGEQSRDFTYVANVVQMNHLAATADATHVNAQVFNTAVGDRCRLVDLTETIRQLLSVYDSEIAQVAIQYGPKREGDIAHSLASIEKAERLLGYRPTHTWKQGLEQAIAWYWKYFN
ncbi:MAG: SDR family oxidoreductase [Bacteroidia bacterium]|jgi:UDP-N-acetylglucosamine 4-epimerase